MRCQRWPVQWPGLAQKHRFFWQNQMYLFMSRVNTMYMYTSKPYNFLGFWSLGYTYTTCRRESVWDVPMRTGLGNAWEGRNHEADPSWMGFVCLAIFNFLVSRCLSDLKSNSQKTYWNPAWPRNSWLSIHCNFRGFLRGSKGADDLIQFWPSRAPTEYPHLLVHELERLGSSQVLWAYLRAQVLGCSCLFHISSDRFATSFLTCLPQWIS